MGQNPNWTQSDDLILTAASCDYWRWGSGGRQENINAICILGLNHINDKVFLLLWWWCLFITLVAFLRLLWRAAQTRSDDDAIIGHIHDDVLQVGLAEVLHDQHEDEQILQKVQ